MSSILCYIGTAEEYCRLHRKRTTYTPYFIFSQQAAQIRKAKGNCTYTRAKPHTASALPPGCDNCITNRLSWRIESQPTHHVQQMSRAWGREISWAQGIICYWTNRVSLGLSWYCLASPWEVIPWAHEISTPTPLYTFAVELLTIHSSCGTAEDNRYTWQYSTMVDRSTSLVWYTSKEYKLKSPVGIHRKCKIKTRATDTSIFLWPKLRSHLNFVCHVKVSKLFHQSASKTSLLSWSAPSSLQSAVYQTFPWAMVTSIPCVEGM
jgi:hypothetical protein